MASKRPYADPSGVVKLAFWIAAYSSAATAIFLFLAAVGPHSAGTFKSDFETYHYTAEMCTYCLMFAGMPAFVALFVAILGVRRARAWKKWKKTNGSETASDLSSKAWLLLIWLLILCPITVIGVPLANRLTESLFA